MADSYKIKSGDTLSAIAKKFGTTVKQLVKDNNIKDKNKIQAGATLKNVGSGSSSKSSGDYKIKSGDTLTSIAKKFDTTVDKLVKDNNIKDKNKIYAGRSLNTSGSKPKSTSSGGSSAPAPEEKPYKQPNLMGEDLAKLYGIDYDEKSILEKFNKATETEYAAKDKAFAKTENQFYDQMYGTQTTALDTIRKNNAAAVATGASRGMQAANELSAILGVGQESAAGATELGQERNILQDEKTADMARNSQDAMDAANMLKQQIGQLDSANYAADTQFGVGEMDYQARMDQASKQLEGMMAQVEAERYAADQNLAGTKYAANQNLAGTRAQARSYGGSSSGGSSSGGGGSSDADSQMLFGLEQQGMSQLGSLGGKDMFEGKTYGQVRGSFNSAYENKLISKAQRDKMYDKIKPYEKYAPGWGGANDPLKPKKRSTNNQTHSSGVRRAWR